MAPRKKKETVQEYRHKSIVCDLVVPDLPYDIYIDLRNQITKLGYDCQGYQKGFWENTKKSMFEQVEGEKQENKK